MDKYILFILFMAILSCLKPGIQKEEEGLVVYRKYIPSYTHTGMEYDYSLNTYVLRTIREPEEFHTTFRTNTGIIFETTGEKFYSGFRDNEKVRITYLPLMNKREEVKDYKLINIRL